MRSKGNAFLRRYAESGFDFVYISRNVKNRPFVPQGDVKGSQLQKGDVNGGFVTEVVCHFDVKGRPVPQRGFAGCIPL